MSAHQWFIYCIRASTEQLDIGSLIVYTNYFRLVRVANGMLIETDH
jgi:hypothetical protein